MIRVSCSKLEEIRKNPLAFVQQLLEEKKSDGGSYGMFQCWQSKVKAIHSEEMSFAEAVKGLQQRFMRYADNAKNKKKQEFLLDRLKPYFEEFDKREFVYLGSQTKVFWQILSDVALTGYAPYIVSKGNNFAAYYFTELPITWKDQLRFPLLQYYLAKNICICEPEQLEIGTYCLNTLSFDLKKYTEEEIKASISETEEMFKTISNAYNPPK